MRVVVEPGVELDVDVRGQGPTLVCLHGFGGAKEDFGDALEVLASSWQVVAPDLRGHGDSDRPDDPEAYSLERIVLDVEAVTNAVGASTFVLLGHSMGGMVARRVALREPRRVAGLVLMSTGAGPPAGLDPQLVDLGAQLARDDWAALTQFLDDSRPPGTPAYERLLAERVGFADYLAWKWSRVAPVMWATLAPQLVREPDGLDALRDLACPALVMIGDADRGFYDASLAMADVIPDVRLVVIAGSGHHPQFEQPDQWLDALRAFLAEVAPSLSEAMEEHRELPGTRD